MSTHELKCWPEFFKAIVAGVKTFEVRRDDRFFKVCDRLVLREFCPDLNVPQSREGGVYTGQEITVEVTYITNFTQQPGYVVMAIVVR